MEGHGQAAKEHHHGPRYNAEIENHLQISLQKKRKKEREKERERERERELLVPAKTTCPRHQPNILLTLVYATYTHR